MIIEMLDGVPFKDVIIVLNIKIWAYLMSIVNVEIGSVSNVEMKLIHLVLVLRLRYGIKRILMRARTSHGF
jgi:hypothetical protein